MSEHLQREIAAPTSSRWEDIRSLYHEFKVCRFSLVVAVLGYFIFLQVPQAVELLRTLGEESTFQFLGSGPSAGVKWVGFVSGALVWSFASWYATRVLLYFDFSADPHGSRQPGRWWKWLRPQLCAHLPRLLGIAPILILASGFWHASHTYDDLGAAAPTWLRRYAGVCVFVAVILYALFCFRRQIFTPSQPFTAMAGRCEGAKRGIGELESSTKGVLLIMTTVSVILLVAFTVNPILFGGSIGAAAVLLFAAGCWVFWGSVAVYIFEQYRIPLIRLVALWIALCSLCNDNHTVRTAPPSDLTRQQVGDAFEAWHTNIAKYRQEPVHPLFIVATEGGGIRAAYWTATVLGELEDRCTEASLPDFSEHLFAISAVSGGSLGAAAFDATVAGGHQGKVTPKLQKMLGEDFLAPPLAAMLYPDLMQRFLPFSVPALDRGQWLERAWEESGKRHLGNDRFAQNFNALWAGRDVSAGYLPALFLNGTSVESGQRIIASNVVIGNGFLDSIDASKKTAVSGRDQCDVPLSTAAHGSARFTYVSPAGRFRDGTHIVDGGYFENSGATTALEILRAVERNIAEHGITDVRPYVILISNDPLSAPSGGRDLKRADATVKLDQNRHRPGSFLEDALAPVWAMVNTRDAHNSYAQLALREGQGYQNVTYFGLSPSKIPLPLGWKLSGTAAQEMNRQVSESSAAVDGKDNPESVLEVINLLNGKTALKAYGPQELPTAPR